MTEKVCRACLIEFETNTNNFLFNENQENSIIEMIFQLTGMKVDKSDGLPPYICNDCRTKLVDALAFRVQYIESDAWLRNQITNFIDSKAKHPQTEDDIPIIAEWDSNLDYFHKLNANDRVDCEDDVFSKEVVGGFAEMCEKIENINNTCLLNDLQNEMENSGNEEPAMIQRTANTPEIPLNSADYKCSLCSKVFNKKTAFNRHENYHKKHKTKCPLCPKLFSHSSNLKRHIMIHKGKNSLSCDKCSESFSQPHDLYEHIKLHRSSDGSDDKSEYLFKCDACTIQTYSYAQFYNHQRTVHGLTDKLKAFQCKICSIRFASKQGMDRHIDNIHENNRRNLRNRDKNYLCNRCGKSFYSNYHLSVHERSHTGQRPFQCQFCDKAFTQISGLKMHTFTHTGEKPFKCNVCTKSFTQYGHVREHMLTHSDERPHLCNICNHSFRVKGNLTAHMLIHMGKKPHVCEHFGKRFLHSTKLRRHIGKSHSDVLRVLGRNDTIEGYS